ncbi:MAG: Tricorn protease like protein, partial [Saprospiraceae bacterium]|nr:Tricorn protease like protein [Saprospiraceae bacterium]
MKRSILVLTAFLLFHTAFGQINAKLMRYMDVSDSQIAFVYGGDIWIVSKTGGTAVQATSSPGEESWPRFSPDGQHIAYTAAYDGNLDVYVMPAEGGVPTRVTHQSHADRMVDWHPDGQRLLFASRREMGQRSSRQFFLVNKDGGFPEKLNIPYGELASFSPDGNRLAYITKITENYPFKRYRGGLASDIIICDLREDSFERITDHPGNDGKPAWAGDKVYFLSDRGDNMRLNLWAYDTQNGQFEQITNFRDFDISNMSAGPEDIVFEQGGNMYLLDLESHDYRQVDVNVVSDLSVEMPRAVDVSKQISNMTAAPEGKRVVFEARGELFNVPAQKGFTLNLTQSSGAFDRNPAWSPDGKHIAWWSDRSGEYEIWVRAADGKSPARQLTRRGKGFGYTLYWSPDSEKLAFIDETNNISVIELESGQTTVVGNTDWNVGHGGRFGYLISWSPDSRWVAFTEGQDNANYAVFLYDLEEGQKHQATSGFYQDSNPTFSDDGKYLFYLTNREFSAAYSDMGDGTWIYPNATKIVAASLTEEAPHLLPARNDELEGEAEEAEKDTSELSVEISFDRLEARLTVLPPDAGNIGSIMDFDGKLVYLRYPNTGSGDRSASLMYYDLEEREEKTIISGVSRMVPTADGKALLVQSQGRYGIV